MLLIAFIVILSVPFVYFFRNYYLLQEKFHVWFWGSKYMYQTYHDGLREEKRAHFEPIRHIQSADPVLKERGALRILEIGAGPGANFEFFPPESQLTVVETNGFFRPTFKENQEKYPSIKMDRFIVGMAEDMKDVEDGSIDVVVSTLVLCSVRSIEQTMKEIQRVLVPGGKYFYWEHIHAEKGTWLALIQNLMSDTKLYDFLFGCYLNRKSHEIIARDPGFSNVQQNCFYHNLPNVWVLNSYTVKGVATKK